MTPFAHGDPAASEGRNSSHEGKYKRQHREDRQKRLRLDSCLSATNQPPRQVMADQMQPND